MISLVYDGASDDAWDANHFASGSARTGALLDFRFTVYAPDSPGTYKVIVFSHGNGGDGAAVEELARGWVEQGFIVIAPTHADSPNANYGQAEVAQLMNTVGLDDDAEVMKFRVDDLRIALDIATVYASNEQGGGGQFLSVAGGVYQFDISDPVVAGHSRGSNTATIAAGAAPTYETGFFGSETYTDWGDDRFAALMTFSGGGAETASIFTSPDAFRGVDVPWLRVTGSLDLVDTYDDVSDRLEPLFESPRGDVHAVFIPGATHATLRTPEDVTPRRGSEDAPVQFGMSSGASAAFLDLYINGVADAWDRLQALSVNETDVLTDGRDVFLGGAGDEIRFGRAGDDSLNGGAGDDELFGGPGRDVLNGGSGRDVLSGGSGRDMITGGEGADTIVGGAGDDRLFYLSRSEGGDVICDFDDMGNDTIDVSAIDANEMITGNQAFVWRGGAPFTGPGQVRIEAAGDDVIVQFNTDGDLEPEMVLTLVLTAPASMTAADFVL